MLTVKVCSERTLFREWSEQVFLNALFWKYINYDDHLFFQNPSNLLYIPQMDQKIEKKFFLFQIIAFGLGVRNSRNLEPNTCHRQSMS